MDRIDSRSAQIIPFPRGGRDTVSRLAMGRPVTPAMDRWPHPAVDCTAWYHQAALQEQPAPRRS